MTGDPLVSIPIEEYVQLLDCRRHLEEHRAPPPAFPRSPIDRDAAIATFLAERFGKMPVKALLAECVAEFGPERTPSMSAAYRYSERIRERASKSV